LTAARLGLRTDECIMIDDIPRNIEGAQATGMQGIVCSSVREVQRELERLLGMKTLF
jgi:FMN phosphatase YigB (HAD superfamily)